MFHHRMQRRGPWGNQWGGPGGFGPGRRFGRGRGPWIAALALAGLALSKRRSRLGWGRGPWGGPGRGFGPGAFNAADPELRSLMSDVRDLGRYLFRQGASGAFNDTAKVRQMRDIIARTRTELETLFGPENTTTV